MHAYGSDVMWKDVYMQTNNTVHYHSYWE